MAITINELIKRRKEDLKTLFRSLKEVDTTVEVQQRRLFAMMALKKKVPERQDLIDLFEEYARAMDIAVEEYVDRFTAVVSRWGGDMPLGS